MLRSSCNADVGAEVLWSNVGAVRPTQGVEVWIDSKLLEEFRIVQRLEHRTVQHLREVDRSYRAIAKAEPHGILQDVPRLENVVIHWSLQWWDARQRQTRPRPPS